MKIIDFDLKDNSTEKKQSILSKADVILVAAVLLIAGVILLVFKLNAHTGMKVRISVDGTELQTLSLDRDLEYKVDTDKGVNIVVVNGGTVVVRSADCPDKICVNHSPISMTGETIICLPHRLVIEIVE